MSNWFEEQFGGEEAYEEYSKGPTADFDLFPEGTRVLAVIEEVEGKTNKSGRAYPAMKLKVVSWPAALTGNYGSPTLYDNMKLTIPESPSKYAGQPEEVVKKKQQAAGIWMRQVKALGLTPSKIQGDDAEHIGFFFRQAKGAQVIIKVRVEGEQKDADGNVKYRAKNTVGAYEEATPAALAKHGLTGQTVAESVPF